MRRANSLRGTGYNLRLHRGEIWRTRRNLESKAKACKITSRNRKVFVYRSEIRRIERKAAKSPRRTHRTWFFEIVGTRFKVPGCLRRSRTFEINDNWRRDQRTSRSTGTVRFLIHLRTSATRVC